MKIAFVIAGLEAGGAERVVSLMANYWNERKHDIYILTIYKTETFYPLHPQIKVISLDLGKEAKNIINGLFNNIKRVIYLRKAIKIISPDIVISFTTQTNILAILASKLLKLPIIASERVSPAECPIQNIWKILRTKLYPYADCIVVQTERIAQYYLALNHNLKLKVVYNPILRKEPIQAQREKTVLSIGRLVHQKGHDLLIKAFSLIKDREKWKLLILGDGPEIKNLERLINDLNLRDEVFLKGTVKNVDEYLRNASIFVLSSRYEGFPNALCEAMALGVASISYDCPTGPSELIENGVNGILVENENVEELSKQIETLIRDEKKRKSIGDNGIKIQERLNITKIMGQWEELIRRILPLREKFF